MLYFAAKMLVLMHRTSLSFCGDVGQGGTTKSDLEHQRQIWYSLGFEELLKLIKSLRMPFICLQWLLPWSSIMWLVIM